MISLNNYLNYRQEEFTDQNKNDTLAKFPSDLKFLVDNTNTDTNSAVVMK